MDHKRQRPNFFKLYFAEPRIVPPSRIYLYYKGRPIYRPATFESDRYSFALPKNLEEKMIAGELFADFNFAVLPNSFVTGGGPFRVPESITLSDRYE